MDTEKFLENFKTALEIEDRALSLGDEFRKFPEWSSLAYLSVLAMIDDEYDVIIDAKDFKELKTLQDVLTAVTQRIG